MRAASNAELTLTTGTETGFMEVFSSTPHPSTSLTQVGGNLGVGIRTPQAKLHVSGNAILAGTMRAGPTTLSTLNVTGATAMDGDIRFVGAAVRKIVFSGEPSEVPDSGEITWYSNDNDTTRNPWAQTDSNESGVLELKVTNDAVSGRSVYGDSIRLDGASGIYLKALDRVIASCKVEARGGLDALDQPIATSGSLRAGTAVLGKTTIQLGDLTVYRTGGCEWLSVFAQ